jgi:hypothetical protein
LTRALSIACALTIAACGSEHRDAEGMPSEPVPTVAVTAPRTVVPPLYDEEGNLLPSEERVAGLALPVGLTPFASEDRMHSYLSNVPIARLLRYFGPRLTTGTVEPRSGGGACYRAATVREATGSAVRLDVTITPVPGERTMVEIRELPPPPVTPPSEAESIHALEQAIADGE